MFRSAPGQIGVGLALPRQAAALDSEVSFPTAKPSWASDVLRAPPTTRQRGGVTRSQPEGLRVTWRGRSGPQAIRAHRKKALADTGGGEAALAPAHIRGLPWHP